MDFQLLGNRILVAPILPPLKKHGAIIEPGSAEDLLESTVLKVGELVTVCKPGDKVVTPMLSGSRHTLNGQRVLVFREPDIIGISVPEPETVPAKA